MKRLILSLCSDSRKIHQDVTYSFTNLMICRYICNCKKAERRDYLWDTGGRKSHYSTWV